MLIPLNVTQSVADLLTSSPTSILIDRVGHCDTIGHCRTVWNIIWSCLITIFACIWVAIHPNIPQPKIPYRRPPFEGPLPREWSRAWIHLQAWTFGCFLTDVFQHQLPEVLSGLGEKLLIALLALLAPEFIFVWALRQWLRARSLAKECSDAASTEEAREARKRRRLTNDTLTAAEERNEFQYLEALSPGKRTLAQKKRHENLQTREADIKESEERSVLEISDAQTSESLSYVYIAELHSHPLV